MAGIAAGRLALACVLLASVGACGTRAAVAQAPTIVAPGTAFIVVRHAEKASDGSKDPGLSAAGTARAASLERLLSSEPVVAIYSTDYQRTRQTALPTAQARGLPVSLYDARLPAPELAARLRADHASGTVLVIGHSNTVPEIVRALSGQAVAPLAEEQFDRLYRVSIGPAGQPSLRLDTY
ncbi:MAG TPA: phosphoglycerate mutase family protein [Pseudoxanthomonas sp.]|nr:phosphoglycerate mutase family protein [Pseudoxanthomonas sp.]